jgi:hypothetical protein
VVIRGRRPSGSGLTGWKPRVDVCCAAVAAAPGPGTHNRKTDRERWWRAAAAPDAGADLGVRGGAGQGVVRVLLHLLRPVLSWVWGILRRHRSRPCAAAHSFYF